jgi:hypothetical protein
MALGKFLAKAQCFVFWLFFAFGINPIFGQTESGNSRLALVIGNSNYAAGYLNNPVNDALLMAKTLDSLSFDVLLDTNLRTRDDLLDLIRHFGDLRPSYDIAFIYYAGHGVQIGYENYLLPTQQEFKSEADVEDDAVSVQSILRYLSVTSDKANILILDACRNNPFESNWTRTRASGGRGLAEIPTPNGSLIAFSTDAGHTAADGNDKNSIYTQSLASNLMKPNVEITQVFRNVRTEVLTKTMNQQSPVENSKLTGGELYLNYQEDKLLVSLEQELQNNFNSLDTLSDYIQSKTDRGIVRSGDEYAYRKAALLFSSFNSLAERLKEIDSSLYQSALFGVLKTGIVASSYGASGGAEFSSSFHINTSYDAATELYLGSKQYNFEPPKEVVKRLGSESRYFQEMGMAYLMYAAYSEDTSYVQKDKNIIHLLEDFNRSFERLDFSSQITFLHIFQTLVINNRIDASELSFIKRTQENYSKSFSSALNKKQESLLSIFYAYLYVESKWKDLRGEIKDDYNTDLGLYAVSELRSKFVWIQNFGVLLTYQPFKDLVSSHLYHPKLKKDLVYGIEDLTLLLKDKWNENDEINRLHQFKDHELFLLVDVISSQIAVLNDYAPLLEQQKMYRERLILTEYKIQAYEALKKFTQHPSIANKEYESKYDYLIVAEKLNCYSNSSSLKDRYPDEFHAYHEKAQFYRRDINAWFDSVFTTTERLDTLNDDYFESYLYFVPREVSFETYSQEEARKTYLNAARLVSRLGWTPQFHSDFFYNDDVSYFWERMYFHSLDILSDSSYVYEADTELFFESIELLQHFRRFFRAKYTLGSGYTLQACWKILEILEFSPSDSNRGLLISEWNELGRNFIELQEFRMNNFNTSSESVLRISKDWDFLLDFVEKRYKATELQQNELIFELLHNKFSQTQVYRDNPETKAFLEGRDRFNYLISGKLD